MGIFFDHLLLDLTTSFCVICGILYYYLTSTYSFWEKKNVPYIKPEIFFGNMKDIIKAKTSQPDKFDEFYHYFKKLGSDFGGVYQMREPIFVVCSADLAKDLLVKNFPSFHDRGFTYDENFDPLSAHLLSIEGQKWKYIRSKLNPAFSTGKLKNLFGLVREVAEELMKKLEKSAENNEMLEMRETTAQYTTDVIGSCAFGIEMNSMNSSQSEFRNMGRRVFSSSQTEKFLQIIRTTYPWIYKTFRLRHFPKDMTDFFINVVFDTMKYRRENNIERHDFLHYLMQIKQMKGANLKDAEEMKGVEDYNTTVDENAMKLTDSVIASQAFLFFLAGFETSSSAMSFALYLLAQHPEEQDKIQEEIERVIEKHGGLTYEALHDLQYMEQVLEETLRIYPAAGVIFRKCTKAYKIPDSDLILEPGTSIFVPNYSFHHDPEYFPEPEEFRPERFSPENREKMVPYSYMPFGSGPRICIGMRFAMMEMKITLSLFFSKFRVAKCEKTLPIRLDPSSFILAPMDGIWLRVVKTKKPIRI